MVLFTPYFLFLKQKKYNVILQKKNENNAVQNQSDDLFVSLSDYSTSFYLKILPVNNKEISTMTQSSWNVKSLEHFTKFLCD